MKSRGPNVGGWTCSSCGCTNAHACFTSGGACWWAAFKICSACATPAQLNAAYECRHESRWDHLAPPVQLKGTKTLQQLAALFKVNASSLRVRIWNDKQLAADGKFLDGRQWRDTYSAGLVDRIRALLEADPITPGRGHKAVKAKKKA